MEMLSDVKVSVIGNVDSGKSTLVGVLSKNVLDDGRGFARSLVFNYNHEQNTGRTTSVAQEIIGFDNNDKIIHSALKANATRNAYWPSIVKKSSRILTFFDLCGHEKYLKTTIFGLMASHPDYGMVVVNANSGLQKMSKEHIGIALALKLPIFFVITKIDICPQNAFEANLNNIVALAKSNAMKKVPLIVKDSAEIETAIEGMNNLKICPIFCLSCVTGENLENFRTFLGKLPSRQLATKMFGTAEDLFEFHIDGTFQVAGVGHVVSGIVIAGRVSLNDEVILGPNKIGEYRHGKVLGIHLKRVPVEAATVGQVVTLALKFKDKLINRKGWYRKGMVLLAKDAPQRFVWEFEAEVHILHHATTIRPRYQAVLHCGVVRQAAAVLAMEKELLRSGDCGKIKFRFVSSCEYLKIDQIVLFREGRTRGIGRVTAVNEIVKQH